MHRLRFASLTICDFSTSNFTTNASSLVTSNFNTSNLATL